MLVHILFGNILLLMAVNSCSKSQTNNGPAEASEKKILVFAKTNGYHHESIADGLVAIQKLGK